MFALILAAGLGLGASAPRAMTLLTGPSAPVGNFVIRVEGGCGPGGHRDRFGYCRLNYPPPRFYRCPPYTHPTPYGCRPNY